MATRSPSPVTDIGMILFVFLFPHFARLPMFIYPLIVLFILWLYLRFFGRGFKDIGFRWKDLTLRSFVLGSVIGIAYALFLYFLLGPLILWLTGLPPADLHDFDFIKNNLGQFIFLLCIACFLVIPYEEIIFRGFIFTTIRNRLSPGRDRFWAAATCTSILFALYHIQEGWSAVISIFIGAIFIMWLYKIFKGNLWYLIFFHAASDVILLTFVRMGYM